MTKHVIKNWKTDEIIYELECESLKVCLETAVKNGVDCSYATLDYAHLEYANLDYANLRDANLDYTNLRYANLRSANLGYANLRGANLYHVNLRSAALYQANLRDANLDYANLRYAALYHANLRSASLYQANLCDANLDYTNLRYAALGDANLRGAIMDFSSWPLHCGSFNVKADDRLVGQLLHHVCKLNIDGCSGGVKEAMDIIKDMAISDLFCEYREDVKPIER